MTDTQNLCDRWQALLAHANRAEAVLQRITNGLPGQLPSDQTRRGRCYVAVELVRSAFQSMSTLLQLESPEAISVVLGKEPEERQKELARKLQYNGFVLQCKYGMSDIAWLFAALDKIDVALTSVELSLDRADKLAQENIARDGEDAFATLQSFIKLGE